MRNRWQIRSFLYLTCLLAFTPGCQMLYRYRPVPVLVRDAESKKPIANAEVHLSYPLTRDSLAPFDSVETTGTDGIAHSRAAPYHESSIQIEVTAPGYLPEQQAISSETVQDIEPAHFLETTERRPPQRVVELFAEPRFSVELIVPAGYRGLVRASVQLDDSEPATPGQRSFSYEVHDGVVHIKGPGVLRRLSPTDYRARYSDGTPLSGQTTLTRVGFRWLRSEGAEQCFIVGTQPEYDMERRTAPSSPHR